MFVTTTRAPGTTAPLGSATVPVIVPRSDCPNKRVATQVKPRSNTLRVLNICFPRNQSLYPMWDWMRVSPNPPEFNILRRDYLSNLRTYGTTGSTICEAREGV